MKQWQIEHRVSSPRNPQSNGMAECSDYESITNEVFRRRGGCKLSTPDIQDYTPEPYTTISSSAVPSPESTKLLLPTQIVPTRLQESYRQIIVQGKQMQAQMYNKNTRVLSRLMQSSCSSTRSKQEHMDTSQRGQIIQSQDCAWWSLHQEQEVH